MIRGGQLHSISQGLDNWYAAWEYYSAELSSSPPHVMVSGQNLTLDNAWKRVGFMRYSPEYWLLARLMVDRLEQQEGQNELDLITNNFDDQQALEGGHAFVDFDQTSMRQVNDLISELKKVDIHDSGTEEMGT